MCSITLNNAQAQFLFKAGVVYDAGIMPHSVAIGDMNGDGNMDLAVANFVPGLGEPGNVSVLLGNGDGTFQNAVYYSVGYKTKFIAIDDLNRDGDLDLAVADESGSVLVLLGNGDGTFQSAVSYGASSGPRSVAIRDLNRDGNLDLAVANLETDPFDDGIVLSNNISVLLGNGDGSFQTAVNYDATGVSVAIGDLNDDGNLDLVTEASVLLGNGDGTLQDATQHDAQGGSVALGDLDGDGDLDLVTDGVSVLLGNGDGTFEAAVNYTAGGSSIAIGDLNGDGNPDLATSGAFVLLGNGDGTFQAAVNYIAVGQYVAIGDLNGDGDLDLAVTNRNRSNVTVLFGNGDGTFQSAELYTPKGGSVAIGDLNGDGDLDLAVTSSHPYNHVAVLLGNGDGSFQTAVNYAVHDHNWPNSIAIGEFNGDGDLDIVVTVVSSGVIWVLLGNGDGSFQPPVFSGCCIYEASSVTVGDLDKDGDLDLAVTEDRGGVSVLLGNGDGTFQSAVGIGTIRGSGSVAIGDLNGDSNLDLVTDAVSVLLGNGDGTFQAAVNYTAEGSSIAIGDLNGDGNLDLATSGVSVLLGNGDGTFQAAVNYTGGEGSVAIGDLNGDGDLDLAVANREINSVSVLLGIGDGTFQSTVNYGTDDHPGSVAVGDLNKDGNPDLVAVSDGGEPVYGISILIYYKTDYENLLYTPVNPCRIVDTRNTPAGMIGVNTERDYNVFGNDTTISAQGGNPAGCPSPLGQPLAAHINMIAVNPTGKGNLQAFPVGARTGAGLSVNYNTIDTNLANAGTVKTVAGSGPDITVASNFSSAHTVIDVLGYFYPDEGFYYTPVDPCRIADTRKTSAGIIDAGTERDLRVFGSVSDQGGNPTGCPSTLGVPPQAAHLNMIAVNPTGKGNLQAFPEDAVNGAGLSVNYNAIDTNLANAGTVKTSPYISVASNFSSAHTVIDVLGYYSEEEDLLYTPVVPCRIVDTRKTSAGIIGTNSERDFHVFGSVSPQGGNAAGCSAPMGEPLAAHINMIAVNPTGKGNLQAFPVGAGTGAGLSVNYNTIDTNLANAGTVKTVTGSGADITVASNFSSAHTVIDVLGYYYPAP